MAPGDSPQLSDDPDVNRTMKSCLSFNLDMNIKKFMSVLTGRSVTFYQV